MTKRTLVMAALAALLVASAMLATSAAAAGPRGKARLEAFRSCDGLVRYGKRHLKKVGAPRAYTPNPAPGAGSPEQGGAPAPQADSAPGATDDSSGTNVQEAGVDEPDIVKTDGSRIFAVAGGKLHAVAARDDTPRLLDSLELGAGYDHQLLLHGGRALVTWRESFGGGFADGGGWEPAPGQPAGRASSPVYYGNPVTVLAEVDVSDPADMKIVRTLSVDGDFVSSRLNGPIARVVISSSPRPFGVPAPGTGTQGSEPQARRARGPARITRWVPRAVVHNRRNGRKVTRALVPCRAVRHSAKFSGLDLLTVVTVDLRKGLLVADTDAVMTSGQTVYASNESLYVATQRWFGGPGSSDRAIPGRLATEIHRFDISDGATTRYRASGEVPGSLLNQFSLSEYRGVLRAATTVEPDFSGGEPAGESESFVTTLEQRGGRLAEMGRVGGLGKGERIYAVRFIDDVGYVVTFRQTDPLYTLDLADPATPKVLGELKIAGYSAYLHPAGRDLLIGVGQDATEEGMRLGTQVSLFDVSDLRNPVRLHQAKLGSRGSSSEVEYDHHAFLYWPPTGLAVIPVEIYDGRRASDYFAGAIGFNLDRQSGIEEAGRIEHEGGRYPEPVRRSLVVGNRLFTVSDGGLEVSDLKTLTQQSSLRFPGTTT